MDLTAIEDFEKLQYKNSLFEELYNITKKTGDSGLWKQRSIYWKMLKKYN